ncbi:MAG: MFS transporter [Candidatus Rokubacteria bacterium]|nr:MFS transporter [Candidatus Rokubacteria bacterium]
MLTASIFLGTVAWTFVAVSLPFHVQAISTTDPVTTLRWTGWILGISSLVTVFTAPLWGRWAERGDPKRLYVMVETMQGVAFVGMALARTLPELFASRVVLGLVGAASTFAFIIAGRSATSAEVRRHVAAVQSAMTVGQVLGPLAGAMVAARIGFRPSFVVGGAMLVLCAVLVRWGVDTPPRPAGTRHQRGTANWTEVLAVALIILGGSSQVFFLPAILPTVVTELGVPASDTLTVSGLLISASGVAAALGSMAAPRLAELFAERRLVVVLLALGSASLAAFGMAASVTPFGVLRFVQVLCIAPVFPIVFARIAQHASGEAVGFVNSARIAAAFLGPVVATSTLTWASTPVVYLTLAALTVACLPLARVIRSTGGARRV